MSNNRVSAVIFSALLLSSSFFWSSSFGAEEAEVDPQKQTLLSIEGQKKILKDMAARMEKSEGFSKTAYNLRYDKSLTRLLELNLEFAEGVAQLEPGAGRDKYKAQAIQVLNSQFELARATVNRFRKQIVLPEEGKPAAEQAAVYSRAYGLVDSMDHGYELWFTSIELAGEFEMDVATQKAQLEDIFTERAANLSVMLEYAMTDVSALRASVAAVPGDKELAARLTVATGHVQRVAQGFGLVLAMMDTLELNTEDYQQQLLIATGQITTDIFDVSVVTQLLLGWSDTLWAVLIDKGPNLMFNLFLLVIIFLAFLKLSHVVKPWIEQGLKKSQLELSELMQRMVVSIVRNIIIILGVLIALSQIGFSLGPLLAGLGLVGFVLGFALQDTLSNFAAGLMILIYRPFDVGDLVDAGSVSGTVSHMSLVNTTIMTLDNQTIIVPNNKIWGDVIKNVTAQNIRRVDMTFGISYSDDIPKTERVLKEILAEHESVLDEPESMIHLHELGDSSVNFIVRPWVNTDDYWDVYWDVTREVKMRFDREGISIPFPQRDLHLYNETSA